MSRGLNRFRFHRPCDIVVAAVGLLVLAPLIVLFQAVCALTTRSSGLYRQPRIGRCGEEFMIVKLRTMTKRAYPGSSSTTTNDPRVTRPGRVIRRLKLDELPQLFNVIKGEMSVVGPRPDVAGFADKLVGDDRVVLRVRPGITGAATVFFRDEEHVLDGCADPDYMSATVLFPLKVQINRAWTEAGTLRDDVQLLIWTVKPPPLAAIIEMFDRWDRSIATSSHFVDYVDQRPRSIRDRSR